MTAAPSHATRVARPEPPRRRPGSCSPVVGFGCVLYAAAVRAARARDRARLSVGTRPALGAQGPGAGVSGRGRGGDRVTSSWPSSVCCTATSAQLVIGTLDRRARRLALRVAHRLLRAQRIHAARRARTSGKLLSYFVDPAQRAGASGSQFTIGAIVLIALTDIFAMLVGTRRSAVRTLTSISPRKTWEGAVGGFRRDHDRGRLARAVAAAALRVVAGRADRRDHQRRRAGRRPRRERAQARRAGQGRRARPSAVTAAGSTASTRTSSAGSRSTARSG